MLLRESLSNKDPITFSRILFLFTLSTSWVPSLPSFASTFYLIRFQFCGEPPICPYCHWSYFAHPLEHILVLLLPIPSPWLPDKWWIYGQRLEVTSLEEIIERQQSICGSIRISSGSILVSSKNTFGTSHPSTFLIYDRWFFTIILAEKFGIFKYWRIDIFNGAADNSPEDSFVWWYKNNQLAY